MNGSFRGTLLHLNSAGTALRRAGLNCRIPQLGNQSPACPQTAAVVAVQHAERARHAGTSLLDMVQSQTGDQSQQVFSRSANIQRPQVAGRVVAQAGMNRLEIEL